MSASAEGLRYFRMEARELLEQLTQGLLSLERGAQGARLVPQLFRQVHTLKGAARVVGQERLAEMAHAVEDALVPYRERGEAPPRESLVEFLRLVGCMGEELAALEAAPAGSAASAGSAAPGAQAGGGLGPDESVRVALERLDGLLEGLSEAVVRLGGLRAAVEGLAQARQQAHEVLERLTSPVASRGSSAEQARWLARTLGVAEGLHSALTRAERQLAGGLGQVESELSRLRDTTHALRLVPASSLFSTLELAARDAAASLGRELEFHAEGGEIQVDGHVLTLVRQALVHAVRNAVDHGLEPPRERRALGKPEAGRLWLRVQQRGARVAFLCEDDGRGVDVERVRRRAAELGLVPASEAEALGEQELLKLLCMPGFSTTSQVTEVSGRGVGLDVVQDTVSRLQGELRLSSQPGRGTCLTLEVPVSLSSLEVLRVTAGEAQVLLPLEALRNSVRVPAEGLSWVGRRASLTVGGEVLPFLPLAEALGQEEAGEARRKAWSVLVLEAGGGHAAVGVDQLQGLTRLVSRPLPPSVPALPLVTGASFDSQGHPLLVVDAAGLVRRVREHLPSRVQEERPRSRPRVLVVDDSVTTRMLEKSILEGAGYEVELAASGEEGLERALGGGHMLVIVDVEMPGMSGLEFTRRLRATPALQHLPVLMVSSLASEEDKRRGLAAGVSAYIVKGEFQQHGFVDTVARLVSRGAFA